MFVKPPPRKSVEVDELVIGRKYWTDSGMGGVFTITYTGFDDKSGRHVFHYDGEHHRNTFEIPAERVSQRVRVCHAKFETRQEYEAAGGTYI
jgi:hypothetical protein